SAGTFELRQAIALLFNEHPFGASQVTGVKQSVLGLISSRDSTHATLMKAIVCPFCLLVCSLFPFLSDPFALQAADVNSVWNGGSGNWSTAPNWTPNVNYPNNGNGLTY